MFIIKKEQITKDIIINVDNNIFLGNNEEEPIISVIDGELKITLNSKVIKPLEK